MKSALISVELLNSMGSDLTVVNCARVSFAKEHKELDEYSDTKLIHYLSEHGHWSPFAHCFLSFRIKAPIFVARQLVKHQVGLSWNEESRRYIDSEPEFYIPTTLRKKSADKKQGSTDEHFDTLYIGSVGNENIEDVRYFLERNCNEALIRYNDLLQNCVAPEQARMVLPLNTMTNWIWSGSLYAFARVCNLRLDPHAQLETSLVAEQISSFCQSKFPISWESLMETPQ